MPPARGLRLAAPGGGGGGPPAAGNSADAHDPPPPPPADFDSPPAVAPPGAVASVTQSRPSRLAPQPAAATAAAQPPPTAPAPLRQAVAHQLPPAGAINDPDHASKSGFGRKKTDVTMKAEYEMEIDRRIVERNTKEQHDGAAGGGGGSAAAAAPFGTNTPGLDDEAASAREALQHAIQRQRAAEADLRRAKQELEAGVAPGGLAKPPTPARDLHSVRTLNKAQLATDAKQRRENLEAQKEAERLHKESGIYRGPAVAAVSVAAGALKQEAEATCSFMLQAMEQAVAHMREERDQLRIRLERAERGLNDDISRVETELNWLDFASSQAKRSLDNATLKKQLVERKSTPKQWK